MDGRYTLRSLVILGFVAGFIILGNGPGGAGLTGGTASAANSGFTPRQTSPKPGVAFLDGTTLVNTVFTASINLVTTPLADYTVTDTTTNQTIAVTAAADQTNSSATTSRVLQLILASAPDVTHILQLQFRGSAGVQITPRLVLNDSQYFYGGNDLGAVWSRKSTSFRLWAPLASSVTVNVYRDEKGTVLATQPMQKSQAGTWLATVTGNLNGKFWDYKVTNFGKTTTAVDPYARGAATDGKYGMIVNLAATNPKGWSKDHYVATKTPTDASIYELHVRDFSIDPHSGMKHKGRYLAFTEKGTKGPGGLSTGVDYLKKLGITHVEIQPIQVANTLKESSAINQTYPAPNLGAFYNWNYDPKMYNAPTAAYATTLKGTARITQVKQMVQALHRRHLGVILDVVYNHTPSTDNFDPIVPGYYYRTDQFGFQANDAGPVVAAERPMVRKFIVDSASYWMKEYHVDGFRFDLLTLLGKTTTEALSTALHKINPHTVLLGEPWDITPGGWLIGDKIPGDVELTKGEQNGLRIGVFNDDIRNGLEGNVFSASAPGYATGDPTSDFPIKVGVVGNISYTVLYTGFATRPEESINYVSSHDNYTLWDRLQLDVVPKDDATRVKMDELANAVVFTSQGVPFMQGGDEFLRTKHGDGNSYQSGDLTNQFDWKLPQQNAGVVTYYSNLIHLRATHPAFRMDDAAMIESHLTFLDSSNHVIAYEITGHANGDKWKNIAVVYNPFPDAVSQKLPSGAWTTVATTGKIGEKKLGSASGSVSVPGYTMMLFYQ